MRVTPDMATTSEYERIAALSVQGPVGSCLVRNQPSTARTIMVGESRSLARGILFPSNGTTDGTRQPVSDVAEKAIQRWRSAYGVKCLCYLVHSASCNAFSGGLQHSATPRLGKKIFKFTDDLDQFGMSPVGTGSHRT